MPRGEDGECGVCELLHSGHQPPPHTEDGDDLESLMTRRSYRCRCRRRLLHHSVGCTSDLGLRLERQAWDCIDCYRDSGVQWRCTHVCGILTLVVQVTVGFLRHSSFTGNGVF
jgi:hypothetical protein